MISVSFPGISGEVLEADYEAVELVVMRALGRRAETVREAQVIHEIKARLDAWLVEQATPVPSARQMFACGHNDPWVSTHGRTICAVCHPPAAPYLVNQEQTRLLKEGSNGDRDQDGE